MTPPDSQSLGFPPAADFPTQLATPSADAPRRQELATHFLPYVISPLIRDNLLQIITADASADASADATLVRALCTDSSLLAELNTGRPLIDAFQRVSHPGASVNFYTTSDLTGTPAASVLNTVDTAADAADPGGAKA